MGDPRGKQAVSGAPNLNFVILSVVSNTPIIPHLATLSLIGVGAIASLPGLYTSKPLDITLPGVHFNHAVSPGGSVPLQISCVTLVLQIEFTI